jgi:Zn-finger nucleic acid-binding protein
MEICTKVSSPSISFVDYVLKPNIKGLGCFTNNCATRMHHHCYDRYTSTTHKCPTCGKDWPDRTKLSKIGEEAARDSDNEKRQVRRRDDEEDDDEEPPESSVEPEARSQKKKAGKRAATRSVLGSSGPTSSYLKLVVFAQ